jgi:hypothetical protein
MDTIFTFIIVNVLDQGLFEGIIFFQLPVILSELETLFSPALSIND